MHELSLAMALVEQIEEVVRQEKATRVLELQVVIGAYSGVELEPFEFCFPLAAEGSVAEGAKLRIEKVPVRIRCGECGKESVPELPSVACTLCGSWGVEIIAGKEFLLRSLEVS